MKWRKKSKRGGFFVLGNVGRIVTVARGLAEFFRSKYSRKVAEKDCSLARFD